MITFIELQVLAKQRNIRGYRKYSKLELCKLLDIEYTGGGCKATPVILENVSTGETQGFTSINKVSKALAKNSRSIAYYIKTKKQISIKDCASIPSGKYILSRS